MARHHRRRGLAILMALTLAWLVLGPVQAASATPARVTTASADLARAAVDPDDPDARVQAEDSGSADTDPGAVVQPIDPSTACQQPTQSYAPLGICQLVIAQAQAVCVGGAPVLDYAVEPEGTPNTTVTLTWQNPGGPDVVMAGLPLSGRVLWPGTVIENGVVVDWPGWTTLPDGSYLPGDEYDWVRPDVGLLFEVNPSATTVVSYPPESASCANPDPITPLGGGEQPVRTVAGTVSAAPALGVTATATHRVVAVQAPTLAETGANSSVQLRLAVALVLAGVVLVLIPLTGRRRARV
ncbi:peptidase [Cellulomonas denverensis]|uniref:Peptidase n=1 Tax=Cellulomonas denverensis TaxID=264297 RepID=A0A7X6KSG8_9CELL|nr:peptidase [Cellulomonas denverensis]NKY21333.1 peptidase [Cellulomonas denverensis]GIG24628.1 hypothetical protein Cde04nite_08720 [Cellulomonas denverensis]